MYSTSRLLLNTYYVVGAVLFTGKNIKLCNVQLLIGSAKHKADQTTTVITEGSLFRPMRSGNKQSSCCSIGRSTNGSLAPCLIANIRPSRHCISSCRYFITSRHPKKEDECTTREGGTTSTELLLRLIITVLITYCG